MLMQVGGYAKNLNVVVRALERAGVSFAFDNERSMPATHFECGMWYFVSLLPLAFGAVPVLVVLSHPNDGG